MSDERRIAQPDTVYTFENFYNWLAIQPKETSYIWNCLDGRCLVHQYLVAHGEHYDKYSRFLNPTMRTDIAGEEPHTYGAAFDRAQKWKK